MLSQRLKQLRAEKGINQIQLAAKMNVTQGTVGKWETGTRTPTSEKIRKLADFFGVTPDYLLLEEDRQPADLVLLTRRISGLPLPEEEKAKLLRQLDGTIDLYLKERQNAKNNK